MEICSLKQRFYHSCLVTSLLMISEMTDQSIEERVFTEGEKRRFDYYLSGILESFVDNTMLSVEVLVDNKPYTDELTKSQNKKNKRIKIRNEKISISLIKKLVAIQPIIVHIDDNFVGDYSHASHFVVVAALRPDGKFEIADPWDGKRKFLTEEKLWNAITSLKDQLKMCPIVIRKI